MKSLLDKYYFVLPEEGLELPPLFIGLIVTIHFSQLESQVGEYDGGTYFQFEIISLDDESNSITARFLGKERGIKRNEILEFSTKLIIAVNGGLEYALKYQNILVTTSVLNGEKIAFRFDLIPDYYPDRVNYMLLGKHDLMNYQKNPQSVELKLVPFREVYEIDKSLADLI